MTKEDELWEIIEEAKKEGLSVPDIKLMLFLKNKSIIDDFNEKDLISAMSGIDNGAWARYNIRPKIIEKMREVVNERLEQHKTVLDKPHSIFRRVK